MKDILCQINQKNLLRHTHLEHFSQKITTKNKQLIMKNMCNLLYHIRRSLIQYNP